MIHKFKNNFYSEAEATGVHLGDVVIAGGVVGVLRSNYNPDFMQVEEERGTLHTCTDTAEVVKLVPVKRSMRVRGYVYPGS